MLSQNINRILCKLAYRILLRNSAHLIKKYPQMCGLSFDHISIYINCFGRYEDAELTLLRQLIEPHVGGTTALDIGANIGNHAVFFSDFFETVHAFEPNPLTYALLTLNTANRTNVACYNFGASSRSAELKFAINRTNIGSSHVVSDSSAAAGEDECVTSIEVRPIDAVGEIKGSIRVGFIKLDVEGHEFSAIQGMKELIERHMPIITFEQHAGDFRNGTSDVIDTLRLMGYTNLYSVECGISRIPQKLPRIFKIPLRILETLIFGDPQRKALAKAITNLEPKNYAMLLASSFELNIPAAPTK